MTRTRRHPVTGEEVQVTLWQASREVPAEFTPDGKRRRVTGTGSSPAAAKQRLEANYSKYLSPEAAQRREVKEAKRREASLARPPRLGTKVDPTVADFYPRWEQYNENRNLTEVMRYKYRGYFQNHILPDLGHRKLSDLDSSTLLNYFNRHLLTKRRTRKDGTPYGKPMSTSGAYNVYVAMQSFLSYAVQQGFISRSPLAGRQAPLRKRPNDDFHTAAKNAKALIDALKAEQPTNPDYCRWLFQFLGLRRSERLGLTWSHIKGLDTNNPRLEVRLQLARHTEKGRGWYLAEALKTEDSHRSFGIPINPFATALREYKAIQDDYKRQDTWNPDPQFADLVFLQPNGKLITPNRDNDDWHKLLELHQIPHYRGHLNRHITATWLAETDPPTPIGVVRAILGHRSEAMTYYYTAMTEKQMTEPMNRYGEFLDRPS